MPVTLSNRRASRARHVANGLCATGCGRLLSSKTMCRVCLDKMEAGQKRHREKGLCSLGCGRPLAGKTACRECLDKKRSKQKQHVASGLCEHGCGRPLFGRSECRACMDRRIEREHGLSPGEYEMVRRLVLQCQACGDTLTDDKRGGTKRCIDHDHKTGVRRGVLCLSCNQALGLLKDSSERARALAEYLERVRARDAK